MRKSALPVLSGVFDCTPIRPRVVSVRALARTRRVGSPAGRINQREGSSAWVCAVPASSRRMRTSPGRLCLPQPPGRTAGKTSHRFRKRTPPPRVGVACGQARQTQSRESIFGDNVGDSAPSRSKPGTPVPVCQVGLATKRGRPVEVRERVEMNATGPRGAGRRKAGLRQPPSGHPAPLNLSETERGGSCGAAPGCTPRSEAAATWLILPVVICLSQRLSHARLSTSSSRAKLRMAH